MSIGVLVIIALAGAGSIIYLLSYLPLVSRFAGKTISPRLIVCKILAPADVLITLFLVAGSWIGLTVAVTGISMIIYNVITGIGLSLGVIFTRKVLVPKWQSKFEEQVGGVSVNSTDRVTNPK